MDRPCAPWTSWSEVADCCPADLSALSPAQQARIIDQVSEVLFLVSGRRFPGRCATTASPCLDCPRCAPRCCDCGLGDGIDLDRGWPVLDVTQVVIDGVPLPPSAYRVIGERWLIRTDGHSWPRCVDLSDPLALEVTWEWGREVPAAGRRAAAVLACELAKACAGLACQLPSRVTTVSREGVTWTVLDSMGMLADGRTGIYEVDLWLSAILRGQHWQHGIADPAHPRRWV